MMIRVRWQSVVLAVNNLCTHQTLDRLTEKVPVPFCPQPIKMTSIQDAGEESYVLVFRGELGAQYAVYVVRPVPQHRKPSTTVTFVCQATCNTMTVFDDGGRYTYNFLVSIFTSQGLTS